MKHLIILGDGMADQPVPALGGKTLLQHAQTPYMDRLAALGRTGMLKTVPDGFHPGSEVANMSILGYDLDKVYEGRGVLEAASIGVDLKPGDMAMRCNLVCVEGDLLKNHSAGHISTEEADTLMRFLQEKLGNDHIHFYTGVQYRHLLVIHGGDKRISCVPPHDIPLQSFRNNLIRAVCPEAQATADLLNDLILRSQQLLAMHPINVRRRAEGKDPANSIWPWSPGYRPKMDLLAARFPSLHKGAVITAVDLIRGIGRYAGLHCIEVKGATGLHDTNYAGKAQAALDALRNGDDFVYLHIEASDEAGHEGDVSLKLKTIEDLDRKVVRPVYEALSQWSESVVVTVLPDHPTPCELRTHTAQPIPFLIWYKGIQPDLVQSYDEESCKEGAYGMLEKDEFMNTFMAIN